MARRATAGHTCPARHYRPPIHLTRSPPHLVATARHVRCCAWATGGTDDSDLHDGPQVADSWRVGPGGGGASNGSAGAIARLASEGCRGALPGGVGVG